MIRDQINTQNMATEDLIEFRGKLKEKVTLSLILLSLSLPHYFNRELFRHCCTPKVHRTASVFNKYL
jgi:hypothetical protein